ncbi:hypothetical protein KIN20_019058 [Parelaphostrongylus tenuis]|uniref:Uncharacterized protein n=1 Tax=Parelaphostrongylus tenuis TaxID=148309 RepID=A0AAD5QUT9_PARTN|nr:hypothetical protein KIN20_019058 [Parelaphostrongylus tenuis]
MTASAKPMTAVCPNGRDGGCMRSVTIYLIPCEACGDEYIGEMDFGFYIIRERLVNFLSFFYFCFPSKIIAESTSKKPGKDPLPKSISWKRYMNA